MKIDWTRFTIAENGSWGGSHPVTWFDEPIEFYCSEAGNGERVSAEQREILEFVCNQPANLLRVVEAYVFEFYKAEIYGSRLGGDEETPPMESSHEIWQYLSQPRVSVPPPHRIAPNCWYAIEFSECGWDEEHGLGVLFNSRGEPIEVGGEAEHF